MGRVSAGTAALLSHFCSAQGRASIDAPGSWGCRREEDAAPDVQEAPDVPCSTTHPTTWSRVLRAAQQLFRVLCA